MIDLPVTSQKISKNNLEKLLLTKIQIENSLSRIRKNFNEAFSSCTLKSSGSWILHVNSINVVFCNGLCCFVLRMASCLDAFSAYPYDAWLHSLLLTTVTLEASNPGSSRTTGSFHSNNDTPNRYHTICLTTILTQLTIPFNM